MPADFEKRRLRQEKRVIKQAGSQRRRRAWKRAIADDPETAHEAQEDLGRHRSALLNGQDQDATRRKAKGPGETA